jgi:hypothetical protein
MRDDLLHAKASVDWAVAQFRSPPGTDQRLADRQLQCYRQRDGTTSHAQRD